MNDLDFFSDDPAEVAAHTPEIKGATEVKKCQACGGNMVWSPADKSLKCEYCGSMQDIDLSRFGEELSFSELLKGSNTWAEETKVFQCSNCGAKEVLAKTEIAKACPFCGTTNVAETQELSGLKPNAVIPFNLTKESASEKVIAWAKKKWFAPKKFKESCYPDNIFGNYTPVFTFDTDTSSQYSGVLGEYYYITRKVNGKEVRERRTRYKSISGTFQRFFDDILVQASSSISQKTIDKLQPFSTNTCNEYSQEFLHGFTASQYSRDGQSCWAEARNKIEGTIKASILAQYTYDFVQSFNYNTSCYNLKFKYLLLPIYVGHCNWKTKLFNFFVNGRSGKVTGKTPLSPIRVSIASFLGAALIAGIGVLAYYLYNGGF